MATLEGVFRGLSGNLPKIQELGYTTVEHIQAADVVELTAGTELTLPDACVAQMRAREARSGQGMHVLTAGPGLTECVMFAPCMEQAGCDRWSKN